ncbi:MAG TPA: type I glyceraldehyde-3-phosphate dehydrogenase [bacterium]|nr:type I glyceraldehyde-3-phosphate dehydrogenase [bacterium]
MARIGINGFGRIGRLVLRAMLNRYPAMEVAAVNDLTDVRTNAHLFKYDSTYGQYPGTVESGEAAIVIDGRKIDVLSERDPAKLPWRTHGVDLVIESTGRFTDAAKAVAHLTGGGAKRVVITAPATGEDITVNMGVNHTAYDPAKHRIVSNGSCTTNCLSVTAKVLSQSFGIRSGFMNTIHSYTNDQVILDTVHRDLRRARAAALNIIPTTTGAAKAISIVLPELKGKMNGLALRVPTPTVSLVDLTVTLEKPGSVDDINRAFKRAAEGELKGYLGYTDEPLVSMDFKGDPRSGIVDAASTMAVGDLVKVLSWYDNEWGYSCRIADLVHYIIERGA